MANEPPSMEQQQADAMGLLAETALHHGIDPGAPGERYQVVVHVDAPVLADPETPGQSLLESGEHVSAETSRRLACDAGRVMMQHARDGGEPFPDVPRPPEVAGDPVATVRAQNEAQGLTLHARTAMPLWLGERLNVEYAIEVLHPLATRDFAHQDRIRASLPALSHRRTEVLGL